MGQYTSNSPVTPWHTKYRISETKCRRCGLITSWIDTEYTVSRDRYMKLMYQRIETPTLCRCEKCMGNTIQDYVSFDNDAPDELQEK